MANLFIEYKTHNFRASSLKKITLCNEIISEYGVSGYDLTLRQLYYQLVARDHIDNTLAEYDRLGSLVSNARMAGLIPWDAIVDRTRVVRGLRHEISPKEAMRDLAMSYQLDHWSNQSVRPLVAVEKEALVGVVQRTAHRLDVPYIACRGYMSQSAMWQMGHTRAKMRKRAGQRLVFIHLGDHDPSGIDMTRDNQERLELFFGGPVEVQRIALNMDQVQQYNPPPNPAKETDPRRSGYVEQYGEYSWELDALRPDVIDTLITEAVLALRDEDKYMEVIQRETGHIEALRRAMNEMEE